VPCPAEKLELKAATVKVERDLVHNYGHKKASNCFAVAFLTSLDSWGTSTQLADDKFAL
jgi:hypothetical protein